MELQALVVDIMKELQEALREELAAQGHNLTGRLSDSIEFDVSSDGKEIVGQMFFNDYGVYVNVGVTADRIPFGGGRGNGGKSAYIQGLIEFWENRGLSGREAVGAAFATAHVHKREGMPSRASYQYSRTGERLGFVQDALEPRIAGIEARLAEKFSANFEFEIAESVKSLQNVFTAP
jgi:hypothetical protein